jgi:hypothetical protein
MVIEGVTGHDGAVTEQQRTTTRVSVSPRAYESALRQMATRGTMRLTANQRQALTGRVSSRSATSGRYVSRPAAGRTRASA